MRHTKLALLSSCGILASLVFSGFAISQESARNSAQDALPTPTEAGAAASVDQSIALEAGLAREISEARGDQFSAALRDLVTRGTPSSEIFQSGLAFGIVAEANRNLIQAVEPYPAEVVIDQAPGFARSLGIAAMEMGTPAAEEKAAAVAEEKAAPVEEAATAAEEAEEEALAVEEGEAAIRAISPGEVTRPVLDETTRIWRGSKVAPPDPYPDVAVILGNNGLCSGTLVTPDHIITAAHCLCRGVSKQVSFGLGLLDTELVRVRVDEGRSKSMVSCDELSTDAGIVSNIRKGDVAVLRLEEPVTNITPRKIASDDTFAQSISLRAIGFGRTDTGMVGIKYIIDILIASHDCSNEDLGLPSDIPTPCTKDLELVAAGLNRDTCAGDSGGPVNVLTANAQLALVAVVSRALDPKGRCGPGGIYVKLRHPDVEEFLLAQGIPASSFLD